MTEEQLNALISWVREVIVAVTGPANLSAAVREGEAEGILRNSFGFHRHSDHSGPFYDPAYGGERPEDGTNHGYTD